MQNRMSVRDARARFCELAKGTEAVAVGNYHELRAIIVPIPSWPWDEAAKKKAAAKARAAFEATLNAQFR